MHDVHLNWRDYNYAAGRKTGIGGPQLRNPLKLLDRHSIMVWRCYDLFYPRRFSLSGMCGEGKRLALRLSVFAHKRHMSGEGKGLPSDTKRQLSFPNTGIEMEASWRLRWSLCIIIRDYHLRIDFWPHIRTHFFWILLIQTKFRLYLHFSEWFSTKRSFVFAKSIGVCNWRIYHFISIWQPIYFPPYEIFEATQGK